MPSAASRARRQAARAHLKEVHDKTPNEERKSGLSDDEEWLKTEIDRLRGKASPDVRSTEFKWLDQQSTETKLYVLNYGIWENPPVKLSDEGVVCKRNLNSGFCCRKCRGCFVYRMRAMHGMLGRRRNDD